MSTNTTCSPMNTSELPVQVPTPLDSHLGNTDDPILKTIMAQGEIFSQELRNDFASFKLVKDDEGKAENSQTLRKIMSAAEPLSTYKISEMDKQSLSVSLEAMEMKQVLNALLELGSRYNADCEALNAASAGIGVDETKPPVDSTGSSAPVENESGAAPAEETDGIPAPAEETDGVSAPAEEPRPC